ncbi:hypothetical protein HUJ05_003413 [Dendroctonus ponderosae]|nr:hypothetical protein HUJ05_003413 [Dendroctonus ponderosae]
MSNQLKDSRQTNKRDSGVGLLVHEKYQENINRHLAPDTIKPREKKKSSSDEHQNIFDRITKSADVIILGNLNIRVVDEIVQGITSRFNEDILNSSEAQLIQFGAQNELRMNNTFFPHKKQHKYTFERTKSTIDYIITNHNIHPSELLDVRVLLQQIQILNISANNPYNMWMQSKLHLNKKRIGDLTIAIVDPEQKL